MHRHKHPNKTHSFPLTFFMYRIKRQNCPPIRRTPLVCCGPIVWQHRRRLIRKRKPVGQILWLDAAAAVVKAREKQRLQLSSLSLLPPQPDRSAVSLSSDCARCCFKITGHLKDLRCLAVFFFSHFFSPFLGFSGLFGGRLLTW